MGFGVHGGLLFIGILSLPTSSRPLRAPKAVFPKMQGRQGPVLEKMLQG